MKVMDAIYFIAPRFGWLATIIFVVLMAKFVGRVSKKKYANRALRKIHIPLGIAIIVIGMVHGLIYLIGYPQAILGNFTGIVLMMNTLLLAATYFAKKVMRVSWLTAHRQFSISLIALTVVHIGVAII